MQPIQKQQQSGQKGTDETDMDLEVHATLHWLAKKVVIKDVTLKWDLNKKNVDTEVSQRGVSGHSSYECKGLEVGIYLDIYGI